ncbi:hypothetical protein QE152_g26654 [Popillia japonica]|uniref:Uncharacterized protein n=1 Tax=Popillia japonica TaxID=7064 RepID=A0AAW1JXP8_POPJA
MKELFNALRKKGNYLDNCEGGKPIKKHKDTKYLPCSDCLGFYSSKNIWKHRKTCCKNLKAVKPQVEAQNFLVRHLKIDPQLRNTVFPRTGADEISLIAKKDFLICAFAARYIEVHREKHFINVASRKMREMAKIVIEMKNMVPSVKNLFDSLKRQYYDNLVMATKNIAKYDNAKENYGAPTLVLNIGTSLKQCCEIAVLHILKRKNIAQTLETASVEADIKTLVNLIEAHWKYDISSQASQDLNIKRWNKVTIVPLASDLKLLKDYLIKVANNSIIALNKNSNDQKAYTNLLETVFCRVVLLNRERPGELQRFPLHTYVATLEAESTTYEEFSEAVSETERILMRNFKRIVIRGKRGRGVAVLFSKDVQDHLQILLKYRDGIMRTQNPYLFGNPTVSEPITGYKI